MSPAAESPIWHTAPPGISSDLPPLFRRGQRLRGWEEVADRVGVPPPLPTLPDAEDLAEGGVGSLLDELRPALRERGVEYDEVFLPMYGAHQAGNRHPAQAADHQHDDSNAP